MTFQRRGMTSNVSVTSSPSFDSFAEPQHGQQAGAGIVADSVPELEHAEAVNKAQAVIRAIERAREM